MLSNYIKIAFRNINRHPTYAAINIIGLSIGIVCSLLLLLFILDELSYDKHHPHAEQTFRVASHITIQDTEITMATTMSPLGPALYQDFTEVKNFLRIKDKGEVLIMTDSDKFHEENIYMVDSSFFSFFNFPLLHGDPQSCLKEPNSIVITESLAMKYFGVSNPVGKFLKTGGDETLQKVTGVMADLTGNSHISPNGLISMSSLTNTKQNWGSLNDHTYLILSEGSHVHSLNNAFEVTIDKHIKPLFEQFSADADFFLQPLTDIHLHSKLEGELEPTGNIYYIYIFSAIAFFMLIIASVNYMNLATARSTNRSREVGIRKAMGSYRAQLIKQFMAESVVLTALAVVISCIVVFFLIPGFNHLAGKTLSLYFITDPKVIAGLIGIILLVGLVGGSYPSFFLSGFNPSEVLKGKNTGKKGTAKLRKALVVAQFSVSLIMVISTWVVFDQLNYLRSKDLGFNKDRVIRIALNGPQVTSKYDVLKKAFSQHPGIEAIGSGHSTPGGSNLSMNGITVESEDGNMIEKIFQTMYIDKDYLSTLEIPMVAGRDFSSNHELDTTQAIIVNEEMVRHMGWKNPIGKKLGVITDKEYNTKTKKVVGVIRDFHLRALKEPILPIVIHNTLDNSYMVARLAPENIHKTLTFLEETWAEIIPTRPFEYNFIEQDFQEQYEADEKRGDVFGIFAILTIMISCLGLFGLASFTAENRKKEIGIRKVVGASNTGIVIMMSFEFLKLVLVAVLIAFPISYLIMNQWLAEFAFRITISPLSFILSALLTLFIAFLTVSYHSIASALSNPSHALRE